MRTGFILLAAALLSPIGFTADIYVPDDHGTIQGAIDAAVNGDTVIVRPGIYVENIDFIGKAILIKSERGPAVTAINGSQLDSVVRFHSGETRDSVLQGFTIANGKAVEGGGIKCHLASPTLKNNIVTRNSATFGAGLYYYTAGVAVVNNVFTDNMANKDGGGISCSGSSTAEISGNIISGNSCSNYGGGIRIINEGDPVITNNIICDNEADVSGGIDVSSDANPLITNNTLFGNSAITKGGGIGCRKNSTVSISNSILWNNTAPVGKEIFVGSSNNPSTVSISHSDVEGGQTVVYVDPGCTLNWDPGNIDADPLFLDPAVGDFHIPFDSPCRSAGDRNAANLPEADFEGDPRTGLFAFPDMGADEFHTHFYVNGTIASGSKATGVIVGWPKTNPVLLISGSGVLPAPDHTPYGSFWLMPPWDHRIHFNPMPDNGVRAIERVVSTGLAPGTRIPFQALVGTELSNLWVVIVE